MSVKRIHLFTVFQIVFFLGVFVVQNIPSIAIIFPFMTLLCIPARLFLAPKIFHGWELCLLDGYDEEIAEWIAAKEQSLVDALESEGIDNDDHKGENDSAILDA
jgi:hypothetical protein